MADDRELDRQAVIAHRLTVQHLRHRLPPEEAPSALGGGLQDGAPRSALLSLHARVEGATRRTWEEQDVVQVWGPRGAVYVADARDVAVFTLGLLPRDPAARAAAERAADELAAALGDGRVRKREALAVLGGQVDRLILASTTGRVRLRWDARDTLVSVVPAPDADPEAARLELLRRFLGVLGPATARGFATWAGLRPAEARARWEALSGELAAVVVDGEERAVLRLDRPTAHDEPVAGVRLLPPADPFLLAPDRDLLVPDPDRRAAVWPLGVAQPGALLVDGELVGTWRRRAHRVDVTTFGDRTPADRRSAEDEAARFPLDLGRDVEVRWSSA